MLCYFIWIFYSTDTKQMTFQHTSPSQSIHADRVKISCIHSNLILVINNLVKLYLLKSLSHIHLPYTRRINFFFPLDHEVVYHPALLPVYCLFTRTDKREKRERGKLKDKQKDEKHIFKTDGWSEYIRKWCGGKWRWFQEWLEKCN